MKFGVYVRSIGERTERLCLESCYQHIDPNDVHLLNNYFPSYNVYREMFYRACKSDYDWFLAVDADVVLLPNWYSVVVEHIEKINPKTTFKLNFQVYDPIYGCTLDRGNHIYNNKYTSLAIRELRKNILITRLPSFLKFFFKHGRYLKPETSLLGNIQQRYGLHYSLYEDVVGIHGAEQYFSEIFRRFVIRSKRNRNPKFIKKYDFLQKKNQQRFLKQNDLDRYVANLGWHYGVSQDVDKVDARNISLYRKVLEELKIKERDKLDMTLEEFYKKYFKKYKGRRMRIPKRALPNYKQEMFVFIKKLWKSLKYKKIIN